MKFKVGDKVKVRKDLKTDRYYGGVRFDSDMRKMKGRTVTIIGAFDDDSYRVEGSIFYWTDEMFENKEYTYEDLKKSPIGTKITFEDGNFNIRKNEEWFTGECSREIADLKSLKDNYGIRGKIIKIEEPEYKTVYEAKPEILDEAEKRYLKGVIEPFRSKVLQIAKKYDCFTELEYIRIIIKDDASLEFPSFSKNTMYKNMEIDKKYTLEELGL